MAVLTLIDVLGIQRFIFASNRLKDVLGGSELVRFASKEYVERAMSGLSGRLVFGVAGNALVDFDTVDDAHEFAGRYGRILYDSAPGLDAAVVHREYDDKSMFLDAYKKLAADMARAKMRRRPLLDMAGLGVTESCSETGLPAVAMDDGKPISRTIHARRASDISTESDNRWAGFLDDESLVWSDLPLRFPKDLDQLGRTTGRVSLVAVVHIDMNDMGARLKETLDSFSKSNDPNRVEATLERISKEISKAMDNAFRTGLRRIISSIERTVGNRGHDEYVIRHRRNPDMSFSLKTNGGLNLPIRPVLLGGDDLTFICDARIAFDVSVAILRAIQSETVEEIGSLSACAGIAISGTHIPFFRLYERSEQLCRSAKTWRRATDFPGSVIDWHIERGQTIRTLSEIRSKHYDLIDPEQGTYRLTCRPYPLGPVKGGDRRPTWDWLVSSLLVGPHGFQTGAWRRHRSKIHALRNVILEGGDLKEELASWRRLDPELSLQGVGDDGLVEDGRTPILDAIELVDLYFELGGDGAE